MLPLRQHTRPSPPLRGLILALALLVAAPAALSAPGDGSRGGDHDGTDTAKLLSLTNDLRQTVGLGPLILDAPATGVAAEWAQRLAESGTLSHNPDLAAQMPEGWVKIGENVGMGGDAESIHRTLARSPTHYNNLVHPGFTRIGIAVVPRDGLTYAVQDFVRYVSDPVPTTTTTTDPASVPGSTTSTSTSTSTPSTTTTSTTTTSTTGAGGVPGASPEPGLGFAVVAPGPAPQLDAVASEEDPASPVSGPEAGRFGFVLEQLRAWDRRR